MNLHASISADASSVPININAMDKVENDHVNKRKTKRNDSYSKIRCTYYDVLLDDFIIFDTHLIDRSDHGLSFFSENHLRPDTPVYIKFLKSYSNAANDVLSQGRHGQVIYCEQEKKENNIKQYRIGIEFFDIDSNSN